MTAGPRLAARDGVGQDGRLMKRFAVGFACGAVAALVVGGAIGKRSMLRTMLDPGKRSGEREGSYELTSVMVDGRPRGVRRYIA